MAHVSGSASSFADLLTALQNACTSNGYSLNGSILEKGSLFVSVVVNGLSLQIKGGTGRSGTTLTGAAPHFCQLGRVGPTAFSFPCDYNIHIHTGPDEVYMWVKYGADMYTYLAFGMSTVAGVTGGQWYGASLHPGVGINSGGTLYVQASGSLASGGYSSVGMFWKESNQSNGAQSECYVNHGLDGATWSSVNARTASIQLLQPLPQRQPNAYNAGALLLPMLVGINRPSNKHSIVADLAHARFLRIDNYNPQDVITLGPDKWMVYPFYRKDSINRNGGTAGSNHSGTMGHAIRYDGP